MNIDYRMEIRLLEEKHYNRKLLFSRQFTGEGIATAIQELPTIILGLGHKVTEALFTETFKEERAFEITFKIESTHGDEREMLVTIVEQLHDSEVPELLEELKVNFNKSRS